MKVRYLGQVDYESTWHAMQSFTAQRHSATPDELWLCEHAPVFTQGLAGRPEHLLEDRGIPVVKTDRGGQITYHGPGQLVAYLLLDMKRRGLTVKNLVTGMEQAVIHLLAGYDLSAHRVTGAAGVYVDGAKIAALGLRIKQGCCYHGLSLNIAMDLSPFSAINPCGFKGLAVTQLSDHCGETLKKTKGRPEFSGPLGGEPSEARFSGGAQMAAVGQRLVSHLEQCL